jgi:hypothetical protein
MVVDREVFHSSLAPTVGCVWTEAGKRHHASFKEGELYGVPGDGTPSATSLVLKCRMESVSGADVTARHTAVRQVERPAPPIAL